MYYEQSCSKHWITVETLLGLRMQGPKEALSMELLRLCSLVTSGGINGASMSL